jgi:hypothetical protein
VEIFIAFGFELIVKRLTSIALGLLPIKKMKFTIAFGAELIVKRQNPFVY